MVSNLHFGELQFNKEHYNSYEHIYLNKHILLNQLNQLNSFDFLLIMDEELTRIN